MLTLGSELDVKVKICVLGFSLFSRKFQPLWESTAVTVGSRSFSHCFRKTSPEKIVNICTAVVAVAVSSGGRSEEHERRLRSSSSWFHFPSHFPSVITEPSFVFSFIGFYFVFLYLVGGSFFFFFCTAKHSLYILLMKESVLAASSSRGHRSR